MQKYAEGLLKPRAFSITKLPPIVFCEGAIDVELIRRAAVLLGQESLLERVALRNRDGSGNLDRLYNLLITDNWETIPQKKLLLYDCDVKNRHTQSGHIYRRSIPFQPEHSIKRGIENLFPPETIKRVIAEKLTFFDITHSEGTRKGILFKEDKIEINSDKKTNFCKYMVATGTAADFRCFHHVFAYIEELLVEE